MSKKYAMGFLVNKDKGTFTFYVDKEEGGRGFTNVYAST